MISSKTATTYAKAWMRGWGWEILGWGGSIEVDKNNCKKNKSKIKCPTSSPKNAGGTWGNQ
ncbi:MAG TPA: hypothetical protein VF865_04290 [Acidobacteriaceae bacterium]